MKLSGHAFIVSLLASGLQVFASNETAKDTCSECKETVGSNAVEVELTAEGSIIRETEPENQSDYNIVPFPPMPPKIRAILHEDWDAFDPEGASMVSTMSFIDGAVEFAHASTTFYKHLKGTFGILGAWDQPEEVRRTGLVHTAYSGDLFQFFLFDANKPEERAELRSIIGEKAEALTYLFGTVHRGDLCHFKEVVNRGRSDAPCPANNGTQVVHHRTDAGEIGVSAVDAANILMVTIADYLDQMVDTNGWKDHHQHYEGGSKLYPGNGRPALGFYWFSAVCNGIRDYLEVIPSVFNHCQDVITAEEEEEARDAYWKVTTEEESLEEEEQINLLGKTVELNPFVGEPHSLMSQIYYRQGNYLESAKEAKKALEKFYALASSWDKRRSYEHWVGFARIMLLRSNRMMEREQCSFPCKDPSNPLYINYNDLKLTPLRTVVKEMKDREDIFAVQTN